MFAVLCYVVACDGVEGSGAWAEGVVVGALLSLSFSRSPRRPPSFRFGFVLLLPLRYRLVVRPRSVGACGRRRAPVLVPAGTSPSTALRYCCSLRDVIGE